MQNVILHIDMNSYFATMEQQAYPQLRGKPVGIAGKGQNERTVIAGASMEAKKFGIKSGFSTWEAKKLCPQLIIIPANYSRYIFTSKRIFSLMERFTPKVEIFSIDEAFIEIKSKTKNQKPKCRSHSLPNLVCKLNQKQKISESDRNKAAEDQVYTEAIDIARQIKQLIRKQIGEWVTCSIGISYGKTLAKLAGELKKPDGLTVIRKEDFPGIAAVTLVQELCGIGYRIGPRLNRMGVTTIADLAELPKQSLTTVFGDFTGSWLYNISHGIDDNIIRSFHQLPQEKSVGHSYTLPQDINSVEDAKKVLLLLCERVGVRLRNKGLGGKTIAVYVRYSDFTGWGQRAVQKHYLMDGLEIHQAACRLLESFLIAKPIRLIGVQIGDLVKQVQITRPIFPKKQKYDSLIQSIDSLNNRYGEFTVFRGALAKIKSRIFNLPDGRNPRTYKPEINTFNSFTKRL